MLQNFFGLNDESNCTKFSSDDEFLAHVKDSKSLENAIYMPNDLQPKRPFNRFRGISFNNVSFSKTRIAGVEFEGCHFEDCLFIGTTFEDCEFHYCTFVGCNPYKSKFSRTYINPDSFSKMLNPKEHSNIGVILFQQLLFNSADMRQPDFAATAEFYFRKWKRYQLGYEYKKQMIPKWNYYFRWLRNAFNQYILGYGVRIRYFLISSLILIAGLVLLNHVIWDKFSMNVNNPAIKSPNLITSTYFTIVTVATLGYGDLTPGSDMGMFIVSLEVLFGFIWLGLLVSILVKRVIK